MCILKGLLKFQVSSVIIEWYGATTLENGFDWIRVVHLQLDNKPNASWNFYDGINKQNCHKICYVENAFALKMFLETNVEAVLTTTHCILLFIFVCQVIFLNLH